MTGVQTCALPILSTKIVPSLSNSASLTELGGAVVSAVQVPAYVSRGINASNVAKMIEYPAKLARHLSKVIWECIYTIVDSFAKI